MSLLAWMPLCGDLKNQGLDGSVSELVKSNYDSEDVPIFEFTDGKIGKSLHIWGCYCTPVTFTKLQYLTSYSFSCWLKINSSEAFDNFVDILWLGSNHDGEESGIRIEHGDVAGAFQIVFNKSSSMGSDSYTYYGAGASSTLACDKWCHIAVTNDGTTTKTYFNGNLYGTYSNVYETGYLTGKVQLGSNGGTASAYYNDVRIYDHVLSALEVKELSKGLMLHYKLSGIGGENLVKGTGIEYTNNDYLTRTYVPVVPLTAGETYTVTLCVTPAQNVEYYGLYFSGGYSSPASLHVKGTSRQVVKKTFTMGYYNGRTPTDDISHANAHFYRFPNDGTVTTNSTIHWVKIEKGNKATPWCPNSADALYSTLGFDDVVEYDCSGYGYNGTKYGTITWSNDTRRYTGSYLFSGNTSYIETPNFSTAGCANSYTISYWGKISDMNGRMAFGFDGGNNLNLYPAGYFCWNTGDGGSNQFKDSSGNSILLTPYNDAWHHYTITGDGTTSTLYIDGEKVGTAMTYRPITGVNIYISGWDTSTSYKWENGNLSDFRLYATCLSESDVKSLHETSASVGKNGVFFAHEFVEVE